MILIEQRGIEFTLIFMSRVFFVFVSVSVFVPLPLLGINKIIYSFCRSCYHYSAGDLHSLGFFLQRYGQALLCISNAI